MNFRLILTVLALFAGISAYSQSNLKNQQIMFVNKDGLAISNKGDITSGAGLYLQTKDVNEAGQVWIIVPATEGG